MFDAQPVLVGELLSLRPMVAEDFDPLFEIGSDPLIWEQHPARDRYLRDKFEEFFQQGLESEAALTVQDLHDGSVIGSSRYHGVDPALSEVEIGWTFLSRAYWGGRYNGELKRMMLQHAFQFVDTVVFLVGPENVRSQRALEKIGARRGGQRVDGSGLQSLVYRITADQFSQ